MSAPSILWFEWFNKEAQEKFDYYFSNHLDLYLRNNICKTVYRKWLREQIAEEINDIKIKAEDIETITTKWLKEMKIDHERFKTNKEEILEDNYMNKKLLEDYCISEIRAYKWAEKQWAPLVKQKFLELKEKYDRVKIKILYFDEKEKGSALEGYQMLKEKEETFENLINHFSQVKYSTNPYGSWFKKSEIKPAIRHRIERIDKNEVTKPIRVENKLVLAELVDVKGAQLDEDISMEIIRDQMTNFLNYGVEKLIEYSLESYEMGQMLG